MTSLIGAPPLPAHHEQGRRRGRQLHLPGLLRHRQGPGASRIPHPGRRKPNKDFETRQPPASRRRLARGAYDPTPRDESARPTPAGVGARGGPEAGAGRQVLERPGAPESQEAVQHDEAQPERRLLLL